MSDKYTRWKQCFENFERALAQLEQAVLLRDQRELSRLEQQGLIQAFEFTFELAWKTLKDYLEENGVLTKFPRDAVKAAFAAELVADGDIWLDMLEKRNLMAHTYDEEKASLALKLVVEDYYPQLMALRNLLRKYE